MQHRLLIYIIMMNCIHEIKISLFYTGLLNHKLDIVTYSYFLHHR